MKITLLEYFMKMTCDLNNLLLGYFHEINKIPMNILTYSFNFEQIIRKQ